MLVSSRSKIEFFMYLIILSILLEEPASSGKYLTYYVKYLQYRLINLTIDGIPYCPHIMRAAGDYVFC